ncbi:hypothetical protein AB1Y20_021506 [Prymnesium parvum]|uniref:L-2-hydroxyglutarate dehydrogenase, mitochondrial n=1 Tax=Prymnesium parvum TaxID=97485 RepID=A0AB34JJT8_PRYPA
MAQRVQTVVAGGGVVGLAVARALALRGREVLVLEAQPHVGAGTSSRHSGVVHAGLYYPPGSLKAEACVAGRRALYRFCDEHGVAYARCGKLVVATEPSQLPALRSIQRQADANSVCGADALQYLRPEEVRAREPALSCVGALFSPSTGIVDSHELVLALQGSAEAHGATVALSSPVVGGGVAPGGGGGGGGALRVATPELELLCDEFVNCAGHGAQRLARAIGGVRAVPPQHYAKGNYFSLQGKTPFRHLIYPVPEQAGLGVHATLDLGGQCRFGPDVEWVEPRPCGSLDFDVDPSRAEMFYAEVRKYWPGLPDGALTPDYAGVRPKIQGPGEPSKDFMVQTEREHGVKGLVNLYGIESPGLTSSLALGNLVASLLSSDV